ncbi:MULTISPECIES: response regulator transcription factor [Cysteiniphilum]|uniref:response regulator transcription factor n=1 Tax=Cysteiniphilum TaxID=2056696 RepID=UPI00177B3B5E|nr:MULTISPECIES: response regulator transcription factor [Cysteiniphilum]
MSKLSSLLIIDDDEVISECLKRNLVDYFGISVKTRKTGVDIDVYLSQTENSFDIILLDLIMPELDGVSVCERIRTVCNTPIIMMTCLDDNDIRPTKFVLAFNSGIDACITKPINPAELVARCEAILRRTSGMTVDNKSVSRETSIEGFVIYHFDGWELNTKTFCLKSPSGISYSLSTSDFELLRLLLKNPGKILSRDFLIKELKDIKRNVYDRSIDVRISLLRKKIEQDPKQPAMIKTVHNKGYMLASDVNISKMGRATCYE